MQRITYIIFAFAAISFASCSSNHDAKESEESYMPKPEIPLVHYLDSVSSNKSLLNNEIIMNECAESIKTDFEAYKGHGMNFLGLLPCTFDSSEQYVSGEEIDTYFVQFSYNDSNDKYGVMLHIWCKLFKEQVRKLELGKQYYVFGDFRGFENTSENSFILPNGHCGNFYPSIEATPTGIPFFDLGVLVIDDLRFTQYSQQ